jgi:lysozyme
MSTLVERISKHEGLRLQPYLDCCGAPWAACTCSSKGAMTIGFGTNLDAGLTAEESAYLRDNRIKRAKDSASTFLWFAALNEDRQGVVIEMIFNMGLTRFCEFKNLIFAIHAKDYDRAASEMLASRWASQVRKRAVLLAEIMRGPAPTKETG